MCTAIYDNKNQLFGRTLDLEYSYNEAVIVTPKKFRISLRCENTVFTNYTIIGMGIDREGFPLYYDAINEAGLAMAGLNFPKSAQYFKEKQEMLNLAPFELIPYILGLCKNVDEAMPVLEKLKLCNISFSNDYPVTPLHWMLADKSRCIVIESVNEGLTIYENTIGVMTNEPSFEYHKTRLEDFSILSTNEKENSYSRGLSLYGLPGDFSSVSRFVRASILLKNSVVKGNAITQFYKILDNVSVPCGTILLKNGQTVITQYASCMDMVNGIYYYKTYANSRICGVQLSKEEADSLVSYPLDTKQDILFLK